MSYDLYMLAPVPGEDPTETLERLEEEEEGSAPVAGVASRNRDVADALMAMNPAYTESVPAGAQHGDIELTNSAGLEITLSGHLAWINFPYWESFDPKELWEEITRVSSVIGDATGWRLYDPQLEKLVDPSQDSDEFTEAFGVGVAHVRRIASDAEARTAGAEPRSLRKRLFGRD